jgi:hypothetical protein
MNASSWYQGRPAGFWLILVVFLISVLLLFIGQTMAVLNYDFAVSIGMQEDVREISEFGVAVNRAFGAGDTLVYIPLILFSIVGLILRKRWTLIVSAAVMGISAYWTATSAVMFWFLEGVPNYSFHPGAEYWSIMMFYFLFGLWDCGTWHFEGMR